MANGAIVRYSDAELEEFRQLIIERHRKAKEELDDLRSQILEISESMEGDFGTDYVDDSSVVNDLEMLNNMAIRKRKYIQDLENAMIRIKNKTYGICAVTGELIDKKRLVAVPTTTKSVMGKNLESGIIPDVKAEKPGDDDEDEDEKPKKPKPKAAPKIITRVIRKNNPSAAQPAFPIDDDDEEDDFGDEEFFNDMKRVNVEDVANDVEDDDDPSDFDESDSFSDEES